jgi:hypothetical protein
MKFLCIPCDAVMSFSERQLPGDGTMAAVFSCPQCAREIAMLTNPMETQVVSGLGIRIGGRTVPAQPLELTITTMESGRADAFAEDGDAQAGGVAEAPQQVMPARVTWSEDATHRLQNVPSFVRGMVKRIYADYARENAIAVITPEIMDRARSELGLEGM